MIITRTPFRMSFFGGGTDIASFYKIYGGAVLSSSFDKYCYVNIRHLPKFFNYRTHLTYSKTESVNSYDEINHPLIREAMKYLDMHDIRLMYDADLPARTGLGTSSSFAVGLLNAFYALKGKRVDKKRLSDEAIYLERVLCKEAGGIQDQIAASYGGLNRIDITSNGYIVSPIIISNQRKKELNENLMLFFTGFTRFSADIQKKTGENINKKIEQLKEMKQMVDEAEHILTSKMNLNEFGKLLHYSWTLKRDLSESISTDAIDDIYKKAREAGAIGGKLLGAGGGGFLLFYVERECKNNVLNVLKNLLHVPIEFENNGTQVVYYTAEDYNLE
ncbi:GHMP family kinase ATP-binding protein [Pectinatus haikarae]|uniref:GHMP family kinase ATP-binding protein n=1 Tax=Pectinatus haikarae TaxID=349096 RepID=UPI0018C848A9|nr:kinase [Pectinatus haikarae]